MKHLFEKLNWFVAITALLLSLEGFAQGQSEGVGINTTTIDPRSVLHIENTYDDNNLPKGIKLPSYDASEIADLELFGQAGNTLNRGLLLFSNENNQIYQVAEYDLTPFIEPIGWGMHGNDLSLQTYGSYFLGTTDPSSRFSLGTDNTERMTFMETGEIVIGNSQSVASDASFQINGTKGLLLPRLTSSERQNISSPSEGLMVYDTDANAFYMGCLDTNQGAATWAKLLSDNNFSGGGGSDNDWTIGSGIIYNNTENVGIGSTGSNTTSLDIHTPSTETNNIGIYNLQEGVAGSSLGIGMHSINNITTNNFKVGLWTVTNNTGIGGRFGILNQVYANGSSSADVNGIYSEVSGAGTSTCYGLRLLNSGSGSGTDYGIYSTGEDMNYFSGNVGIGLTNPDVALDVVGVLELSNTNPADPGTDVVRLGDGGTNLEIQTNYGYVRVGPANTSWSHFSTDRDKYYFDKEIRVDQGYIGSYNENLSLRTEGTTRMTILNADGKVGVGTTSPSTHLHVSFPSGTTNGFTLQNEVDADKWHWYVYSSNNLTLYLNGNLRGSFDNASGNYTASSDRRLKKNITPVGGVLNNLMKLNLVEYNYKQQTDKRKYTGFIAQEVKEIFPSLVYYQDEDDLFFMDYAGVGPLAVKAIQEQQKMIEEQQEELNFLRVEVEQLKRKIK